MKSSACVFLTYVLFIGAVLFHSCPPVQLPLAHINGLLSLTSAIMMREARRAPFSLCRQQLSCMTITTFHLPHQSQKRRVQVKPDNHPWADPLICLTFSGGHSLFQHAVGDVQLTHSGAEAETIEAWE